MASRDSQVGADSNGSASLSARLGFFGDFVDAAGAGDGAALEAEAAGGSALGVSAALTGVGTGAEVVGIACLASRFFRNQTTPAVAIRT